MQYLMEQSTVFKVQELVWNQKNIFSSITLGMGKKQAKYSSRVSSGIYLLADLSRPFETRGTKGLLAGWPDARVDLDLSLLADELCLRKGDGTAGTVAGLHERDGSGVERRAEKKTRPPYRTNFSVDIVKATVKMLDSYICCPRENILAHDVWTEHEILYSYDMKDEDVRKGFERWLYRLKVQYS